MNFSEWLTSSVGTGGFLAGVAWIFRNWIITRLKNAVGHEYNVKLENHKAKLKAETDKQLLELKSRADVEFEKFRVIDENINHLAFLEICAMFSLCYYEMQEQLIRLRFMSAGSRQLCCTTAA
jgi:hypothetical protein